MQVVKLGGAEWVGWECVVMAGGKQGQCGDEQQGDCTARQQANAVYGACQLVLAVGMLEAMVFACGVATRCCAPPQCVSCTVSNPARQWPIALHTCANALHYTRMELWLTTGGLPPRVVQALAADMLDVGVPSRVAVRISVIQPPQHTRYSTGIAFGCFWYVRVSFLCDQRPVIAMVLHVIHQGCSTRRAFVSNGCNG